MASCLVLFLLTCEMALKALVLPIFSPPLETDSAECMAVLAASSTPSLIFLPISVRVTSSRPCGHIVKTYKTTSSLAQLQSQRGIRGYNVDTTWIQCGYKECHYFLFLHLKPLICFILIKTFKHLTQLIQLLRAYVAI